MRPNAVATISRSRTGPALNRALTASKLGGVVIRTPTREIAMRTGPGR